MASLVKQGLRILAEIGLKNFHQEGPIEQSLA